MTENLSMTEETLLKAISIARRAHQNQVDKSGAPYIGHPLRVMKMGRGLPEQVVGVLHDVVEDSPITFDDLARVGFDTSVLDALRCVTKTHEDEPYDAFIARVVQNPLAVAVKVHDLIDNMDVRRLPTLGPRDFQRLNKYLDAYHRLLPLYRATHKKRIFFDMDGVLVDFESGLDALDDATKKAYQGQLKNAPHLFRHMKPLPGAQEAVRQLAVHYEVCVLSTAPWLNTSAWTDKVEWLQRYFPNTFYKRITITHLKNALLGEYLIDDSPKHGAITFPGEHIPFGSPSFPDWASVLSYLLPKS